MRRDCLVYAFETTLTIGVLLESNKNAQWLGWTCSFSAQKCCNSGCVVWSHVGAIYVQYSTALSAVQLLTLG